MMQRKFSTLGSSKHEHDASSDRLDFPLKYRYVLNDRKQMQSIPAGKT